MLGALEGVVLVQSSAHLRVDLVKTIAKLEVVQKPETLKVSGFKDKAGQLVTIMHVEVYSYRGSICH